MDYYGLSWIIMDYHGLSWVVMDIMDYHEIDESQSVSDNLKSRDASASKK